MPYFAMLPFICGLTLCALCDLFSKKVPNEYLVFLYASGLPVFIESRGNIFRFVISLLLLIIFLLLYGFWGRFLGGADVKIFLIEIIAVGIKTAIFSLGYAFILSGIFSILYLPIKAIITGKKLCDIKKGTIPLVPFLLISFCIL